MAESPPAHRTQSAQFPRGSTPGAPSTAATPVAGSELQTPAGLERFEFGSMGTRVECLVPVGRGDAAAAVRELFGVWHRRLTRFDPGSELSRLNAQAGREAEVSAFLFHVVETALRAADATDGLFDPALLHELRWLGYDRDFALVLPSAPWPVPTLPLAQSRRRDAWRSIRLDRLRRTVWLQPGVAIDLGGIAKGMAADAAVAALERLGALPAAVNAGGDAAVTGTPGSSGAWQVAVERPEGTRTVALHRGAIATSGISRRSWWRGGRRLHHLLDPRTGLPADSGVWSVSVAAPRCEQAEVAAKAAFVLGPEDGGRFLERWQLPGLFVLESGREIEVGPWRAEAIAAGATGASGASGA